MDDSTFHSGGETVALIGDEGTPVFGENDQKIGMIQRVVIDKISGRVSYAVVSLDNVAARSEECRRLPWSSLKYDASCDGYRTAVAKSSLHSTPQFHRDTDRPCQANNRAVKDAGRPNDWDRVPVNSFPALEFGRAVAPR